MINEIHEKSATGPVADAAIAQSREWKVCREPFRLFFSLGLAAAIAGVLPWLLFSRGMTRTWPGAFHAAAMTQSFLIAVAIGFLGTMIPRRTQQRPMSRLELGLFAGGVVAVPVALHVEAAAVGQAAYLALLIALVVFVGRRLVASRRMRVDALAAAPHRPPPPSFVLIPISLVAGLAGGVLLLVYALVAQGAELLWAWALGKQLTQQGVLIGLVLALAPMLHPIFATGDAPPDGTPRRRAILVGLHLVAGLALLASFPIETFASERAGLLVRAAVTAAVLGRAFLLAPVRRRAGLHRALFRFALLCIPLGLAAAALNPGRRIPSLHLTFIAGLAMLVLAVSVHVTLLHTGREAQADRRPWPVALAALLLVGAAGVRLVAERWSTDYFLALFLASSLFLAAVVVWGVYLVPKTLRPRSG